MSAQFKLIEVNYHYHQEFTNPAEVISKHAPSNLFMKELAGKADITLVKHINFEGSHEENGVHYRFFRRKNRFFQVPTATHNYIRDQKPDIVLVQGLIFPWQVIALRKKLGKNSIFVLQHQGEVPYRRKRIFQKIMDRFADGYVFTSVGNAEEFIKAGIIRDRNKIFEIAPSSTTFLKKDKAVSRQRTGMQNGNCFLWVGRLNAKKDPLTVLTGLEKYFNDHPDSKLYMIYGEDELLQQVKQRIEVSNSLRKGVVLVGKVPHQELEDWYSAADYFVSGSIREGGSFALTEAIACGCIPIVSNIPAAMKVIDNGKNGFYFERGDSESLYEVLKKLDTVDLQLMSGKVLQRYEDEFSSPAIAKKVVEMYFKLKG
jgi:glycosyltransferase involved in cell wall biosynthesis